MTTRQYARLLSEWVASIGLDPHLFGTHSLRRTKATLIYRRPATCQPCSYCSATPRLRAPLGISALRSMTPFPSRNRSTSELVLGRSQSGSPERTRTAVSAQPQLNVFRSE